jgi:hypothetical protein
MKSRLSDKDSTTCEYYCGYFSSLGIDELPPARGPPHARSLKDLESCGDVTP